MEFGRVPEETLNDIDFKLPAEPAFNKGALKGKPVKKPKLYLGCAKWGRKEWLGKIYPPKTKEAQFLDHYVDHYNSIELNATHYKTYGPEEIQKWADKAKGKNFVFCPKVPQSISHYSTLINAGPQTDAFLEGVMAFGKHLGPIFLQLSDRFSPNRRDNLFKYLENLPQDLSWFVEVRHPDWYSDEAIRREYFDTLRKLNVGAIITDAAGRRDCLHMELTVPRTFIRYVGNSLHPTDYVRIDDWVNRIHYWLQQGLQELYFFMHMHNEAYSPELTVYLVDKLQPFVDVELLKPKFVNEKGNTLF